MVLGLPVMACAPLGDQRRVLCQCSASPNDQDLPGHTLHAAALSWQRLVRPFFSTTRQRTDEASNRCFFEQSDVFQSSHGEKAGRPAQMPLTVARGTVVKWIGNVGEIRNRNQQLGVKNQNQERGGEPEYTPPHGMSCGAMDENRRCKPKYIKELRQIHPLLKCLSRGAVDTGPMSPPTYYGQRDNGCHESEKMPIFKAFVSAYPLSNQCH